MKKIDFFIGRESYGVKKLFLIMRITLFILFVTLLNLKASPTYSQRTLLSLDVKDGTIKTLFETIENQSDFKFFYQDEQIFAFGKTVNLSVKKETVNQILDEVLVDSKLTYKIIDNHVLVYGKGEQETKKLTGVVKDATTGEVIPGVTVMVKGTTTGTITDVYGKYVVEVQENQTLVYSFVGMKNYEVVYDGRSVLDVTLEPDLIGLDEVVAIGYGTQKKSDLTGAIASVTPEEMKKFSTSDVSQMMQGRMSGVSVTSDGQPGATPTVRIRGFSTFGDESPLYVVDGVPLTGARDLNPNDIESMSVLKDASAGAIYGAAAANGVILITTKKGKKDMPLKITYSGYYGVDKIWQRVPVTNREEFQTLQNEMLTNAGMDIWEGNDPTSSAYIDDVDTDWQDEGLKTGTRQNHNLNFTGGGTYSNYSLSLDYFGSDGTLVGSGPNYERYSIRMNSQTEKGIFKIGENLYYTHSFQDGLTASSDWLSGGRPPMIVDLLTASPIVPVYDDSRVGGFGGTSLTGNQGVSANVVGLNSLITNTEAVDRILANFWGEMEILDGLKYKINMSYDKTFVRKIQFSPLYDMGYFINNLESTKLYDDSYLYTRGLIENTLTYDKTIGVHSINALAGTTYSTYKYDYKGGYSENVDEEFMVLDNGENQSTSGNQSAYNNNSYFGRINYSYNDKYLLTVTSRWDASSKFAEENRWGMFPSVALGWKIHNEEWIPLPEFIYTLKFRGSYGQMGNDKIDSYLYSTTVNENIPYNFNGTSVSGAAQTQLVDEEIKWETKTITNIGFDMSFLQGAIEFSAEYYNSKSTDLLTDISIPATTGANNDVTTNAASMRNYGIETSAAYHKKKGDFTFDIMANFSTLDNEVLELGGGRNYLDGTNARTAVGRSIGEFYGYEAEGIFQEDQDVEDHAFQASETAPGDIMFKDIEEDETIDESDRTYLGRAIPKYFYGLNFSGQYKKLDFTFNVSGSGGNKINGRIYTALMHCTDYQNYSTEVLDRWTENNHSTKYPRLIQGDPNANVRMSNRYGWLQDGDFLRINTVSVGYTFPKLIKYMSSLRVYATAQNVYTFQAYKGYNPDFTSGVLNPGYDDGSFPKPRTILFGVQASF